MMFRGLSAINIDAKGRVALPTRYRERLSALCEGRLILTIDTESPCLLLYPFPQWEIIEQKLQALPSFNAGARRIQRLLMGHATECELDGSGRFLIPGLLRDYADFDKKIMLVGQGNKFELWDEQLWSAGRETWLKQSAGQFADLPDDVTALSL